MLENFIFKVYLFPITKCLLKLLQKLFLWRITQHDHMGLKLWPGQHAKDREICLSRILLQSFLALKIRPPRIFRGRIPPGIKIRGTSELLLSPISRPTTFLIFWHIFKCSILFACHIAPT